MPNKKGLLERLNEGVVIGDGGFTWQLEKRGYVKAGAHTPEVVIERPDAVLNLHREFLDAGSDVMQAFTFYASDDKLSFNGNYSLEQYTGKAINTVACQLARKAADLGDALVCASISQIPAYLRGEGKAFCQSEYQKQIDVFVENGVDFIVCEFFFYMEEMEWAIEISKKTNLPVVATMCVSTEGDMKGVSTGECGVRMAKAGASVVGVNCLFDWSTSLEAIKLMKSATEAANINVHFITQPLGFLLPEKSSKGYLVLPEYPLAMESRTCTRFDFNRYAREAYDLGVRYIGGCCGTEAYHIRAVTEELEKERGAHKEKPFSCIKHEPWGGGLKMSQVKEVNRKACRSFWENLHPSSGRPHSSSCAVIPSDVHEDKIWNRKK